MSDGFLVRIDVIKDRSPIAQVTRMLDIEMECIKAKVDLKYHQARALAFAEALSTMTCLSVSDIKEQVVTRYDQRARSRR